MPSEKLWKCKSWSFLPVTFFRYLFETTHEIMYHKCLIFLFFNCNWFPVSKYWVACMSRVSLVLFHLIVLLKIMSLTPVRSLDTYLVLIQRRVSKDYSIQIRAASKWFCCSMISIIRNEFSFSSKEYFTFFLPPWWSAEPIKHTYCILQYIVLQWGFSLSKWENMEKDKRRWWKRLGLDILSRHLIQVNMKIFGLLKFYSSWKNNDLDLHSI